MKKKPSQPMSFDQAKIEVKSLVEKYHQLDSKNRLEHYNEEMTKKDFILPLFRALGWDVENSEEVTAEERVSKKKVDYGFRISGIPQFFLEAKSFKAGTDKIEFVQQAINYSHHKGCAWAVLTDFREVKIFNAEWRTADLFHSRFKTLVCHEFIDRFEELWLLSKDAFADKLLDKEARKYGKKALKKPIDKQLLEDFTRFREMLSKSITRLKQHSPVSEEELDESVQRLLNRLIFIRNCEDREMEPKNLLSITNIWKEEKGDRLLQDLRKVFRDFRELYNSNIFDEHLADQLLIDGAVLCQIIEGLYSTDDGLYSYDFSDLEADALGSIYEQYLGNILKKTERRAKLRENHNHRKEQGIYYTPPYIVDYIVRNTLGQLLNQKQARTRRIKVLDPACGSGSFLIKVFDILNNFCASHDRHYYQPTLDFEFGIPYTSKTKILMESIFGLDLDRQAVQIAQLNLLLKIAEKGRRLPILEKNIRCGDSLVDNPLIAGDKAFSWEREFKEIMDDGGFDVIIGNPPYVFARDEKFTSAYKKYFYDNFELARYQLNTYVLFVERAYRLLREGGYLGFIIPNTWLTIDTFSSMRKFLREHVGNIQVINIHDRVFEEANVDTCVLIFKKGKKTPMTVGELREGKLTDLAKVPAGLFPDERSIINISMAGDQTRAALVNKISAGSRPLGTVAKVSTGLKAYQKGKGEPPQDEALKASRAFHALTRKNKSYGKYLEGRDVMRYYLGWSGKYLSYGPWLAEMRRSVPFTGKRILVRQIPSQPPYSINAVITDEKYYHDINSMAVFSFKEDPFYLLGILNSKLISFWFLDRFDKLQRRLFPQFKVKELASFPIAAPSNEVRNRLAQKVQEMMRLKKLLEECKPKKTDESVRVEKKVAALDDEIDCLVYDIYKMNTKEKRIIEETLKK